LSDETSWLDGEDDDAAWLDEDPEVQQVVAKTKTELVERTTTEKAYTAAKQRLTPLRRILLETTLVCPTVKEANDVFADLSGKRYSRTTLHHWRKRTDFKLALELGQRAMMQSSEAFTKEGVMRRNEQIYQSAMEPKADKNGFVSRELGHALTALDQRSKMLGLYGDEKPDVAINLNIDFGAYGDGAVIEGELADVDRPD
jgi:hypothetical protein